MTGERVRRGGVESELRFASGGFQDERLVAAAERAQTGVSGGVDAGVEIGAESGAPSGGGVGIGESKRGKGRKVGSEGVERSFDFRFLGSWEGGKNQVKPIMTAGED